ncbi:hypothetical protein K438DRAFT_1787009 [Mycena galopus ATCC 62051]|nr:hypothetical protein K438DRAFT_1787009 [Mycena galopus ATCC 62051]
MFLFQSLPVHQRPLAVHTLLNCPHGITRVFNIDMGHANPDRVADIYVYSHCVHCMQNNQAAGRPSCSVLNYLTDAERVDLRRALWKYDSSTPVERAVLLRDLTNANEPVHAVIEVHQFFLLALKMEVANLPQATGNRLIIDYSNSEDAEYDEMYGDVSTSARADDTADSVVNDTTSDSGSDSGTHSNATGHDATNMETDDTNSDSGSDSDTHSTAAADVTSLETDDNSKHAHDGPGTCTRTRSRFSKEQDNLIASYSVKQVLSPGCERCWKTEAAQKILTLPLFASLPRRADDPVNGASSAEWATVWSFVCVEPNFIELIGTSQRIKRKLAVYATAGVLVMARAHLGAATIANTSASTAGTAAITSTAASTAVGALVPSAGSTPALASTVAPIAGTAPSVIAGTTPTVTAPSVTAGTAPTVTSRTVATATAGTALAAERGPNLTGRRLFEVENKAAIFVGAQLLAAQAGVTPTLRLYNTAKETMWQALSDAERIDFGDRVHDIASN